MKHIDKLIKYGIAAILIIVPLYPKFPFINIPGVYVSIRIEDFLILFVFILWLVKNKNKVLDLWKNPIIRSIVIFLIVGFLATFSGIFFVRTATPLIGLLEWARRGEYLIGFFIAFSSLKSQKDLEFYVKCIGISLVIIFLIGIAQKYFAFPVITTQNSEYSKGIALRYVPGGHLASTFAGHYDLATYIILTSPIFIALLFSLKETLKVLFGEVNLKLARGILVFIIATSFWLMVNAASRISAASYVLAISTTLFILRKYKHIPIIAIITLIFAFSTSNLFDRYLNIFEVIKNKLMGLIPTAYAQSPSQISNLPESTPIPAPAGLEDRSTTIRLAMEWPRAMRAFLKNPLLGTGYSSITLATDNDYLRALGETGLLGLISLFFIFFRIIKNLITKAWPKGILSKKEIDFKTAYLAGIIGVIPGILLNAVFIDIFEASKVAIPFWILIGFAIALITDKEKFNYEK